MSQYGGIQDTSLTISSTASSTQTFPSVSPWIYSLLTEIINSLPATASTFEQLFTRYQHVLAEKGIDEAEAESEQDAYAVLLKLSMQRGTTWAQKWANAQRALPPSSTPSLDVLKARLDHLDGQPHPREPKPKQHLTIPYIGARLSSHADGPLTSTPQRPRTVSAKRTMPPLQEQVTPEKPPRRVSFLSPRPASSASHSRSNTLIEDSYSDEPDPYVLTPHPRRPHSTPPAQAHSYSPELTPDPKIILADRYRRANILTSFFDRWRDRNEQLQLQSDQTAQLRQTVVVKRSLAVWRLKLRYVQDVMEPKAEACEQLMLARRTLSQWVLRSRQKRKAHWEEQMRRGLEQFKARTEPKLLAEAFEVRRRDLEQEIHLADRRT